MSVEKGIVDLTGEVSSYFEKEHATEVASRIKGVLDTVNDIQVNCHEVYSDATLKKRIEDRLSTNWETGIVAKDIHVQVANGDAVLTGKVDTWGERSEADRLAVFTKGIRGVDNRITVVAAEYPWEKWSAQMHQEGGEATPKG